MKNNITLVTGLWDIGRNELSEGFEREFDEYIGFLSQLLRETEIPIILYTTEEIRSKLPASDNLFVIIKSNQDLIDNFEFSHKVDLIRQSIWWWEQGDWLKASPQGALTEYNVITFSKYFLLNDATLSNPFNSKEFYWIDAGIARTLPLTYLTPDLIDKISKVYDTRNKLLMLSYPYTGNNEIHGFAREGMNKYCGVNFVDYVCRGGFFGGSREIINQLNNEYWNLLKSTLDNNYMGTEESIFTIMAHTLRDYIERFDIGDSGLIYNFFEDLKHTNKYSRKQALYVLTYNSPAQFKALIQSFEEVDDNFLRKPVKYLINNSTDVSTFVEYDELCSQYNFEQIKFDNIGINGGRQFVADHFDESNCSHYIFFEDDMLLSKINGADINSFYCRIQDIYNRSLSIIEKEELSFLKLSFTEFYGSNDVQFAWYNIPQDVREKNFPDNNTLPVYGLSLNAPKTKFSEIRIHNGLTYALGEVYYCNWPLWFSREGNSKVFLTDRWPSPFEQTWMSHTYNLYVKGEVKSAVLLASPINHHRFDHYTDTRKEN